MKRFRFFLVKLILILCTILLQSILAKSEHKVSESIIENYKFQEQLISCEILIRSEHLSLCEESEGEQEQYFYSFYSFQNIINNYYNSNVFPLIKKHIKSFILFESDNSPPFIIKS